MMICSKCGCCHDEAAAKEGITALHLVDPIFACGVFVEVLEHARGAERTE